MTFSATPTTKKPPYSKLKGGFFGLALKNTSKSVSDTTEKLHRQY